MRATDTIKGRILTPAVVKELEGIHAQHSLLRDLVHAVAVYRRGRLLVWGVKVQGGAFLSSSRHPAYTHVSPFIVTVVLEENSKDARFL
jgi:hypothetical protein